VNNSLSCPEQQEYSDYLPTPAPDDAVSSRPNTQPPSLDTTREQILRGYFERQHLRRLHAGSTWVDYDLIFCNSKAEPIGASNLGRVFHRLLKVAGLPQMHFHDLRHTAASLMLNNGIAPIVVGKRPGHSKTSTTFDVYSHLFSTMQSEAAEKIETLVTPFKWPQTAPQSIKNAD
jgi:integrase